MAGASRAGELVLMMNERRPRSGHYADGNLRAAGIRECEQYALDAGRADRAPLYNLIAPFADVDRQSHRCP